MGFLQQRYTETGKMQNDNRVFFNLQLRKKLLQPLHSTDTHRGVYSLKNMM